MITSMLGKLLMLSVFIGSASAVAVDVGKCPDLAIDYGFQLPYGVGKWYLRERLGVAEYADDSPISERCTYAEFTLIDGEYYEIEVKTLVGWKYVTALRGTASRSFEAFDNIMDIQLSSTGYPKAPFNVLFANEDFLLVAGCLSCGYMIRYEYVVIMEREPGRISEDLNEELKEFFGRMGVKAEKFQPIDQVDCPPHLGESGTRKTFDPTEENLYVSSKLKLETPNTFDSLRESLHVSPKLKLETQKTFDPPEENLNVSPKLKLISSSKTLYKKMLFKIK